MNKINAYYLAGIGKKQYLCSEIATRSRISNCSLKLMNLLFRQE